MFSNNVSGKILVRKNKYHIKSAYRLRPNEKITHTRTLYQIIENIIYLYQYNINLLMSHCKRLFCITTIGVTNRIPFLLERQPLSTRTCRAYTVWFIYLYICIMGTYPTGTLSKMIITHTPRYSMSALWRQNVMPRTRWDDFSINNNNNIPEVRLIRVDLNSFIFLTQ